eukprot:6176827-Pleurochrysis_carterae.AAC.1
MLTGTLPARLPCHAVHARTGTVCVGAACQRSAIVAADGSTPRATEIISCPLPLANSNPLTALTSLRFQVGLFRSRSPNIALEYPHLYRIAWLESSRKASLYCIEAALATEFQE